MIYKKFHNLEISALGLGCMRLPQGADGKIDKAATEKMVDYAFQKGINYFDTAWGYHDGESETVMGEILKSRPRESFFLADKFPGYDLNNIDKVEKIFETQLKKCQVDYFDFYLVHNVCELNVNQYINPKYGILEYLSEQKQKGRIRHLGFSAHGDLATIKKFLSVYGEYMEFCQLQVNWLDWNFQDAQQKVALMTERNLPVWVMEPLRGGSLAKLQEKHSERLSALRPDATDAEWAFRFVQSIPNVVTTLSGMSNFEQLQQNIETFSEDGPTNADETALLLDIAREMTSKNTLPCTSCRYCTSHCPQRLDIPWLIELYNEHVFTGGGFIAPMAMGSLEEGEKPSACIGCRECEAVCPQGIKISEMMTDFCERLK